MNCEFSVYLPPVSPKTMAAGESALDVINEMEDLLSAYRGDSALAYLNHHAARRPVNVDQRLYQLLQYAAQITKDTQGAFDVATGALIKAWGFFRGPKRVPQNDEIQQALACCGMDQVTFNEQENAVAYATEGLEINLGSIGKGYAIDQALELLRERFDLQSALMLGGQSSIVGLGTPREDDRGWLIGIQNPLDMNERVATVRLRNRALGSAGAANQYFEQNGRRYGHVLDPRTGRPADELAGVSVVADNGATADALATALFVMGVDKATDFCKNHPRIGALLLLKPEPGTDETSPRVVTFNLPRADVDLNPDKELSSA
jgi:thiamine biosynthesis lipoprotein